MLKFINKLFIPLGYEIRKFKEPLPADILEDKLFLKIFFLCQPYTMTSIERMYALYQSVNYVLDNNIPGDFVECGVWKGGSAMLMAYCLIERGIDDRKIYLYDTFEGMSEPTDKDKTHNGDFAKFLLQKESKFNANSIWCYSSFEEVKKNLEYTKYNFDNFIFIKGKVEDTLMISRPIQIALLRLDTDWYESTKVELETLFPLLETKGVLIIDDFGHWEGAKSAVLEYFNKEKLKFFLHRVDYTGRLIIKY